MATNNPTNDEAEYDCKYWDMPSRCAPVQKPAIGRFSFKFDKPASDKQRAYLARLIEERKAEVILDCDSDDLPDVVTREFWSKVSVPANLTNWEASNLIGSLQGCSAFRFMQSASHCVITYKDWKAGKAIVKDTTSYMAATALVEAINYLATQAK